MSATDKQFSDVIVERFARAWASIDGKAEAFDRERGLLPDDDFTGTFEGYMEEARELLQRANCFVSTTERTSRREGFEEGMKRAAEIVRERLPHMPPDGPINTEHQAEYEALGFAMQAIRAEAERTA